MVSYLRRTRVVPSVLALAALLALSIVSVAPAQAATNATLGDLSAASPAANNYAGCVAAVLTGSGITFGSSAALGSTLAALWPTLPAGVADTCRQAVDSNQPQVCVNPIDPATCPAVGGATAAAFADQAARLPGNWKLVIDGLGVGGYAQTSLATSGPPAPMATLTGTFTTPTSVCTSAACTIPPPPGLWADCGPTNCGEVFAMKLSVIGRTPNGENGVKGHIQMVDGFGNVTDAAGIFGNDYWGTGCGAAECGFTWPVTWTCKSGKESPGVVLSPANCGGQMLTVSFTFDSGTGGGCACASPAPALGQVSEIQLTTDNLHSYQNATVCPGMFDCLRHDDGRLSYLDAGAHPTAVEYPGATLPSAVINLAPSDLACLVGVDVTKAPAVSCHDLTGALATLLQTAHAPVVASPPATAATSLPLAGPSGWATIPVTVTLTATDLKGPGVRSITYSATGAQATPETTVNGGSAQVVVSADGVTTLSYWATNTAGSSGAPQSLVIQVDSSAPALACAVPSTAWSPTDVTVACTAGDRVSGLADPTQSQFALTTSVAAATETAAAATGSVTVCDVAGNCTTKGPLSGLKVDRLAPTISVTAPTGSYTIGQYVRAAYTCTDGGSAVATCTGTSPAGSGINTASLGAHTFVVDAVDAVGNRSQFIAAYSVTAPVCSGDEEGNHQGRQSATCDRHGFRSD